jgi:pimeloyl-ACP methyl ester carboxylesterase
MNTLACCAAAALVATSFASAADDSVSRVRHATVAVDGVEIFYREAGPSDAPVVLLLHGFPSSSFMYRELIPALADRWHVVAPDYPGFGASEFPPAERYEYSFAHLAHTVERFAEKLGLDRYALYLQDYGAPIGLRVALRHPERVTALVVQNGNAYEDGLSAAWDPLKAYWREPRAATREQLRGWLTEAGIREQYVAGVPAHLLPRFSPDTWTLDWLRLARPGAVDVQLQLFGDYRGNVELYPQLHALFRERRWPTLVLWGRHDPFFTERGAHAYRRDLPNVELHLLDAGHFALETHAPEIAALMRDFLERHDAALRSLH